MLLRCTRRSESGSVESTCSQIEDVNSDDECLSDPDNGKHGFCFHFGDES